MTASISPVASRKARTTAELSPLSPTRRITWSLG
jgi:hypothetical protein